MRDKPEKNTSLMKVGQTILFPVTKKWRSKNLEKLAIMQMAKRI